jgi:hypothetical protein
MSMAGSIEILTEGIQVDATIIADGLGIAASSVADLMRAGQLTSLCERGVDEHQGRFRLSFFYAGKRFRLVVDEGGTIIQRSTIDFGDRPLPTHLRRPRL